jgi:hypothetical protein
MVRLDAPCLEAGLYWHDESPQVSFRRVCQLLIQEGMDTVDFGEFATPNDALLAGLEQPHPDMREVSFMTSSKKHSQSRPTRRPPGKLIVSYGWLSDAAKEHEDHPAIQVVWGGGSFSGPPEYTAPDASAKGLQAYRFFTLLCAQLDPLYAVLEAEIEAPCLYDALHPKAHEGYSGLPLSEFYCQQGLLGDAAESFWRTYAYHERLPHGVYGSDKALFNPRRRLLDGDCEQRLQVMAERRAVLMPVLKHFARRQRLS